MNSPEDKKLENAENKPIRFDKFIEVFNETTMTCLPICNTCVHHIDGLIPIRHL